VGASSKRTLDVSGSAIFTCPKICSKQRRWGLARVLFEVRGAAKCAREDGEDINQNDEDDGNIDNVAKEDGDDKNEDDEDYGNIDNIAREDGDDNNEDEE
jgi:hypothetical protein